MKIFMATVTAIGTLLASQLHTVGAGMEQVGRAVGKPFVGVHVWKEYQKHYVDCEDVETNGPCVTFDDVPGGWVMITQYEPVFKEHRIRPPHKHADGTYTLR
jgi:hypothetical protein